MKVQKYLNSGDQFVHLPSYCEAYVSAGAAVDVTIPTDPNGQKATRVIFSATGNFYVNFEATATVPGATTSDGSSSILNPASKQIASDIASYSIIAASGVVVTQEFFA